MELDCWCLDLLLSMRNTSSQVGPHIHQLGLATWLLCTALFGEEFMFEKTYQSKWNVSTFDRLFAKVCQETRILHHSGYCNSCSHHHGSTYSQDVLIATQLTSYKVLPEHVPSKILSTGDPSKGSCKLHSCDGFIFNRVIP